MDSATVSWVSCGILPEAAGALQNMASKWLDVVCMAVSFDAGGETWSLKGWRLLLGFKQYIYIILYNIYMLYILYICYIYIYIIDIDEKGKF